MNFIDSMKKYLSENAMSEDDVEGVIALVEEHALFNSMQGRLNEDVFAYPNIMMNLCIINIKVVALEYIDEHCPQAWFRTCLLPEEEQRKLIPEAFK